MKSCIIVQAQLELDADLKNEELFYKIDNNNILEYTLQQALKCNVDKVILFYSRGNKDSIDFEKFKDSIIFCEDNGEGFLKQFHQVAEEEKIDIIIRVIGNNPLIIPRLIDLSLKNHIDNNYDYTYFKGYPIGIRPSEIISKKALDKIGFKNIYKEYARYISTSLMNDKDLRKNCFNLLEEYKDYDKVDLSFSKNKSMKIAKVLKDGINFDNIKKVFKPIPNTIKHIEITNVCNISCIMCSRSGEFSKKNKCKKGFMNFKNFKKIIDKFEYIDELALLGGEPLLNPDIKNIIKYCVEKNIKVNLITNGLLLNKGLSKFLIDNIHSIRFSIDGPNKDMYELIRRHANFDTLISNIKEFMNIYKESKNYKIQKIGINYVYMKQNYKLMPKMIKLVNDLEIKEISFNPYCNPIFITDEKTIDEFNIKDIDDLNGIFDIVRVEAKKFDINVKSDKYDSSWIHNWNQCEYIESFYITWDGYITPCCAIDKKELFNLGSILHSDIDSLYNSDKWFCFRNSLMNNNPYEVCKKNCYYYYGNLKK